MEALNRGFSCFLIITKKYFKDVAFLLTFLAIPFLAGSVFMMSGNDEAVVRVAMYASPDAKESQKLIDRMEKEKKNAILFYKVDSLNQLEMDIKSGYATSGFELPDDLEETIRQYVSGNYEKLQFKKAVAKCYFVEKTNFTSIAQEFFFAGIYKDYARAIFFDSMEKRPENADMTGSDFDEIEELYNSYNVDNKLFVFENINGTVNKAVTESRGFLMLAVRGLVYALILLASMLGALAVLKDDKKGVFSRFLYKRRPFYTALYILIPTIFTGAVGFVTINVLDLDNGFFTELRTVVLFILLASGAAAILKLIFKNIVVYATLIPLYVMANVILCNVFVDVSQVVPYTLVIRLGLPLYYALTNFNY